MNERPDWLEVEDQLVVLDALNKR